MDDRIGELPDDILISILSRLTIDEAARANVLSYRWRYLWRSFTDTSSFSSLMSLRLTDVDIPEETLHYLLYYCPLLGELRPKVTERLMRIRVSGRSLYLKCLEVQFFNAMEPCIYVQNIKDDPHLNLRGVSFIGFEGREVDVEFLKDLLENAVR
ncbi:hypothetical protein CUMW_052360 [Citrus unshiu]|nr:hypothetical protein CUMW_052360 [Citrus unshiu]